jgi:hypothetical protein
MAADELRRQADVFVDLVDMQSRIGRNRLERPLRASEANLRGASAAVH